MEAASQRAGAAAEFTTIVATRVMNNMLRAKGLAPAFRAWKGLTHIARHVIQRILNSRLLN